MMSKLIVLVEQQVEPRVIPRVTWRTIMSKKTKDIYSKVAFIEGRIEESVMVRLEGKGIISRNYYRDCERYVWGKAGLFLSIIILLHAMMKTIANEIKVHLDEMEKDQEIYGQISSVIANTIIIV